MEGQEKSMIHAVKIIPEYYEAVKDGRKRFEVRKADRPYKEGDYIALNEHDVSGYTGRSVLFKITYLLNSPLYCKEGYVILGIAPCGIMCEGDEPFGNAPRFELGVIPNDR